MLDIKAIRQDPEGYIAALARRGAGDAMSAAIEADRKRRETATKAQEVREKTNDLTRRFHEAKKASGDIEAIRAEAQEFGFARAGEEANRAAKHAADEAERAILEVPNRLLDRVPDGADESGNVVLKAAGMPKRGLPHWETASALGYDPEAGAMLAGSRMPVLRGAMARLERALGQFMLDLHTREHGYEEISVPYFVRTDAMHGTGQLPKFYDDLYRLDIDDEDEREGKRRDERWLIPTAEVPLTNLARCGNLLPENLPLRLTALTPCFRAEAGAAGRDTRGLMRQHQFHKVELVSVVLPEEQEAELERMTACAERVLDMLDLPWRRVLKCAGDTGFSAAMTYDLEVWMPGQEAYREISSCSACGDFQSRRMGVRLGGARKGELPATLNGSGVAVGRALAALVETHWDGEGVTIPVALRPYLGSAVRLDAQQRQPV